MTATAILWPVLAHVVLVFGLYVWLTVARFRAVRSGQVQYSAFEFGRDEPPGVARITRNLANQFELPVIFYAAVVLLLQYYVVVGWDVAMVWLFVAGRVVHTVVQTRTNDVRLRGRVFTINFLGVAGLVGHLAVVAAGLDR